MRARFVLAVVGLAAWPAAAFGDPPTANALLHEGAEHFTHEDYEGARAAFARAYDLEPKAPTLFNLALAELNADHPVEAAAHLRAYLTHADEPAAKLESVRTKWLPRAEARTARLDVFAPAGAEVLVDGAAPEPASAAPGPAGAPLSFTIAAGEHEVVARHDAVSETQHVSARGGELVEVHLQRVADAPPPPGPIAWGSEGATVPEHAAGTTPRAKWITVLALGSGAVALAALGVGFGLAAESQANDVTRLHSALAPGGAWTGAACAGASGGTALCAKLRSAVAANREDWTVSTASYIGAGVLGAAALATWMLWKPKPETVVVGPAIGLGGAGAVFAGPW